jgi:GntR family transcriptional regulator/MocR family aminotransferase
VSAVEVHVSLVGRDDLTNEIYRQLRQAILDGRLRAGERLPPTRELARRLSVARGTVTLAYEQLTDEGYATARVGAGTFVSDHAGAYPSQVGPAGGALRPRSLWATIPPPTLFGPLAEYDFRSGIPDARLFPYQTWRRLLGREFHAAAADVGAYADPAGHHGLRQAVARYLGVSRGVSTTAEDVVVTNGTQQAVDIVARVLLDPGDQVAVEDPGYGPPRRLLASLGAKVAGVPVDDQGLVVDAIPPGTRLVYVTPSHQFPLGMTMSLPRRLALLAWARRHDAAVVEDDYDSEFRYGGRPIEPLQTMDAGGRVVYQGSFSKTMLPSLRLGFVVAPPSLRQALRTAKHLADWHSPLSAQAALARFIDDGWFARHVRKMRAVYQERHRLVVDGLRRRFAEHLEPAQVLHDRDGRRQQRRVHRARQAAGVVDVHRVDADQPGLLLGQPLGGGGGEERVAGAVPLGAPVAVPPCVDQHGSASNVVGGQHVPVDRGPVIHPHHDAVQVGDAVEGHAGHIGRAGEAVERAVEVGAGVGHHRDPPDLEGGAGPVAGGGRFPGEVVADLGSGQTRIGHHSVLDPVAQLDETALRGPRRIRRRARRPATGRGSTSRPFHSASLVKCGIPEAMATGWTSRPRRRW